MGLLSRIFRPSTVKAAEGQYRDGPWFISSGWIPALWPLNFWQTGRDVIPHGGSSAMVEACVSAYAQTVAMCPGDHWRLRPDGGRDRVDNSALSRILRAPNEYQSFSDFGLNLTRCLYLDGNAYALALRNDRFEIAELHLMDPRHCGFRIAETGDIFYSLGGNPIVEQRFGREALVAVPQRDVLHIRLNTPRHPLKGESPLMAALIDVAAAGAMTAQQLAFWQNQARPSFLLGTDEKLTAPQVAELRERWDAVTQGENAGKTPILTAGLKPMPISVAAKDTQLAELMKMTDQRIAEVFRIPLQILGIGGTPFASTEALMQSWKGGGLGFALNHIEEAIGRLFRLKGMPFEYLEFNTDALLRSAFKDRIEALSKSVKSGIHAPNEARAEFELSAVPFGDEPRIQMQDVTFSQQAQQAEAAQAAQLPAPQPDAGEEDEPADERDFDAIIREYEEEHARSLH